jgi:stage IV sporulation protein B
MKKKILLIILLMFPYASYAYSDKIIPGGNTIGIEVSSPGVMVVGFYKVDGKYNRGKPELKNGDYIIKINDEDIETVNDLVKAIDKYKMDKKVNITFTRNKIEKDTVLNLVEIDGVYKTGLYVKDSITGIGTLSYIDPESKIYGALGHEIIESNSKEMVEVKTGNIFRNYITSIDRSENGSPGSKNAKFYNNTIYGDIKKNTKYGI